MRPRWAPVAGLMLLAPFLAEVVGGAMPPLDFIQPAVFFPFVIFLYGLPVLVIRELATRYALGPLRIWILGMSYGLFNEGLLSETLYAGLDHAVPAYASYGLIGGLRVPWLLYILPWHATLSVLIPIMIIDRLWPKSAGRPWIPLGLTRALAVAVPALAIVRFISWGEDRPASGPTLFAVHLVVVLVTGAALGYLASRNIGPWFAEEAGPQRPSWRLLVAGAIAYAATTLAGMALAHLPVPPVVYVIYAVAMVAGVGWWASRTTTVTRPQVLSVAVGALVAQAATGVVAGGIGGNTGWLVVGVIVLSLIGGWLGRLAYDHVPNDRE